MKMWQNGLKILKNGRILDPANGMDEISDILIKDGKIAGFGRFNGEAEVIDATGCWIMPGFIDLHVHFREPGQTHKEDLASGLAAAAAGGFTTVCTMPNTTPAVDSSDLIDFQIRRAKEIGLADILPVGAITTGLQGKTLAPMAEMAVAGAAAFSEDGFTVRNAALQKQAMEVAAKLNIPIFSHCEDENLAVAGVFDGAESVIAARDILLAELTGAHVHICHVSTAASVQLICEAKARGVKVTAEAAPHHFVLCKEDFDGTDTNFKMNPPLQSRRDLEAIRSGLADCTIDAIATDHAPHHADEKAKPYADAPNGIVGLETALSLALTELVGKGLLTPLQLAEKMSAAPAKILGINKGNLAVGRPADIVVVDPNTTYSINPASFTSKGKNTPFGGRTVKGRIYYTIFDGRLVYDYRQID